MKRSAIMITLAGLGLGVAATPSYAQGLVYINTFIAAPFTASLTSFAPNSFVDILATDAGVAPGVTYAAGQLGWDGTEFQVLNLTQDSVPFADKYNITPTLFLDNLLLTENFSNGTTQNLDLFDIGDPTLTPTNTSDPFDFAPDGVSPLTGDLLTNPVTLPTSGPTLSSVVLTGVFSSSSPSAIGANLQNPTPVPVQIAVVPEAGSEVLLLAGLMPLAGLALRARRAVRRS